jgi:uncharacterized protein (DUF58 family)
MTSRLWFLCLLVYGLFLAALLSFKGEIVALTLPLVIYLTAVLIYSPQVPNLVVERELSTHYVTQGTQVVVKLTITNQGKIVEEALIEDILPLDVRKVSGDHKVLATILAGGKVELEYVVEGKRGSYNFDSVDVTVTTIFGLLRVHVTLSAPAQVWFIPEVIKLRSIPVRPLRTHGFTGPIPSRRVGNGINFIGLRDYQPGDPLRKINWRVSARYEDQLYTSEFEQERITDIGIILDARFQNDIVTAQGSLFEYMVRAAAGVADAFLADGDRVGLLVYGRGLEFTISGYGKVQRQRILKALARARTGSSYAFERLDFIPTRLFPARSQIVLISPLVADDIKILIRLKACGYDVLVICPDTSAYEVKGLPDVPPVKIAARIIWVERALFMSELKRMGVQVVDWQVDSSLDQAIQNTVGRQLTWMRHFGVVV